MSDELPVYDRELLLLGAKRNAVLDLWEVQRYGSDSYGDTDYVSVYGMRPAIGMRRAPGFWDGRPSNARAIDWGMRLAKRLPLLLALDHPAPGRKW
jgi:hypothetical protein